MSNLRPVPITNHPADKWQNVVQRVVQSQHVKPGRGLRRSLATGDFTQLTAIPEADPVRMIWRGDYDITGSYQVNDVIRVSPQIKYVNPATGYELPIGGSHLEGYSTIPLSMGLFVCVSYVPPAWANTTYFNHQILPQFQKNVPPDVGNSIRWYQYNVYYPVYPEIPKALVKEINLGYGFTILANNTFWQALPYGAMPMTVCVDGEVKTYYVTGAESGSKFNPDYLPYKGP